MTNYQLFGLPNCEKCSEAKAFLKSIDIKYSEINLGMPTGKKEWGKILVRGYKPKTDDHGYIMPILVKSEAAGIETIVQGPEDIRSLFQ
jgi:glutaredoxin